MKFQIENAYLQKNNQGNRFVSIASSINVYDPEKFLHKGGIGQKKHETQEEVLWNILNLITKSPKITV